MSGLFWLAAVMLTPGAPPPAWEDLASRCSKAVLVLHATDLATHGQDALNVLGMSFPDLAAREALKVGGPDHALNLANAQALKDAGVDGDAPLLLCWVADGAPWLVVPVAAKDARCQSLARQVSGATSNLHPSLCAVDVASCGVSRCESRTFPTRRNAVLAREATRLQGPGIRLLATGDAIRTWMPRQVRTRLGGVDGVVVRISQANGALAGESVLLAAKGTSFHPEYLRPLDASPVPQLEDAAAVATFSPTAAAQPPHAPFPLPVQRVTAAWFSLEKASTGLQEDWPFTFTGETRLDFKTQGDANAAATRMEKALAAQGFEQAGMCWASGWKQVRVEAAGPQLTLATGALAQAPPVMTLGTAAPAGTQVQLVSHGRRLRRALASAGGIHSMAVPGLREAAATAEFLGPSLDRLGDLHAAVRVERAACRTVFSAQLSR